MAIKFEITEEEFNELDESMQALYERHGDGYRASVEGIDPADELKEALRKEREERAEAKRKLTEYEQQQEEAERKRLEEKQEFESLYKQEAESKTKLQQELDEMRRHIADKERGETAMGITSQLSRDTAREELLREKAIQFIHYTPEGEVKINGPDGEAWDADKLSAHLKERYPFLVDGNQSTGSGATGSHGGGAASSKKFTDYTGQELATLRQENPDEYNRLKAEYHDRR